MRVLSFYRFFYSKAPVKINSNSFKAVFLSRFFFLSHKEIGSHHPSERPIFRSLFFKKEERGGGTRYPSAYGGSCTVTHVVHLASVLCKSAEQEGVQSWCTKPAPNNAPPRTPYARTHARTTTSFFSCLSLLQTRGENSATATRKTQLLH